MAWWQWIITIAGICGGIGVVWKILEELVDARRAYPVLMEIAEEFKPNNGASLHDRISVITDLQAAHGLRLNDISAQLEQLLTR
jgi:hypothetical protein